MTMSLFALGLTALPLAGALASHAGQHQQGATTVPAYSAAIREFKAAHMKMMRNMKVPFTGDPDVDFFSHMIPHHQGAIDMAGVAMRHANNPWTRQEAEAITIAQSREVYEFRALLAKRAAGEQIQDARAVRAFKAVHAKMMRAMAMPFTGDPDVDFKMHMVPHHQGAIDMARVALRHARDPWTRQAAEAVIIEQQQEIHQFQRWLAQNGAKVPPGGRPLYIIGPHSFPQNTYKEDQHERAGTRDELVGQTWAPGSGVPSQP
jgi:uncharacterized protein (DUF305 family)